MKKTFTVNDLPQQERPRERLANYGSEVLSLSELLAIILGRGTAGQPVMQISQTLVSQIGSINTLLDASLEDLQQIKGLGFAKACQIKAVLEIARRTQDSSSKTPKSFMAPADVHQLLKPKLGHLKKEHFVVISFDSRNKVIGFDTISVGTLNASLVHPRETFEPAIRRHAASIIIAHNHPSNDPQPSDEDIKVTAKLVGASKLLQIELLDHIIVCQDSFFSLKGEEML